MCLEWEKSLLETYSDTETVSSVVASSIIVAHQLDKPGEHFGVHFESKHTRREASVVSFTRRRLAQLTTRMVTTDVTSRLLKSMGVASVSNPFRIRISMSLRCRAVPLEWTASYYVLSELTIINVY